MTNATGRQTPHDGLRVGVGDVRHGHAVAVVADARDRRGVRAKRRAREQQPALGAANAPRKPLPQVEVFAEVVRLIDDHDRVAREPFAHRCGVASDPRVGDRDAVEAGGGPRRS